MNFQSEKIRMYWQGKSGEKVLIEDLRIKCIT